jgi:hypothetical protein
MNLVIKKVIDESYGITNLFTATIADALGISADEKIFKKDKNGGTEKNN